MNFFKECNLCFLFITSRHRYLYRTKATECVRWGNRGHSQPNVNSGVVPLGEYVAIRAADEVAIAAEQALKDNMAREAGVKRKQEGSAKLEMMEQETFLLPT